MLFDHFSYPVIFAHRGSSAYAPENTVAAFDLAVRHQADAIELDAKLSADGQVVVIHDRTVDRTTAHKGKVRELAAAEMHRMDAGSHFDAAFRGEPIPTLDDVFEAVGQALYINVELTNYASITDDLPDKVAELVRRRRLSQRVMFSSFNPLALLRIRRLLPEVPVGLLSVPGRAGGLARSWPGRLVGYQSLHPELRDVTPELVQGAHRRGCKVFVYTVNREEDMRRLLQLGVDGLITDDPILARQVAKG